MNMIKKAAFLMIYVFIIIFAVATLSETGASLSTFPFIFILPAVATIIHNRKAFTVMLTFFSVLLVSFAEKGILPALTISVIAAVFAFAGIYVKRLIITAYVSDKKVKKLFCSILAAVIFLISLCAYSAIFGNPFSASVFKKKNIEYIKENYAEHDLKIEYTVYDFSSKRYFTKVVFEDEVQRNAQISVKNNIIIDGYHNYYEYRYLSERAQKLSFILSKYFKQNISVGSNIVETDIILAPNRERSETYSEMVFDIYFGMQISDEKDFAEKCKEYHSAAENENFEYKALKFYGGNAGEFYYEMTVPSGYSGDFSELVRPFNENHFVKREDINDYKEYWDIGA